MKVTVILPVLNKVKYIKKSLDSIDESTYKDFNMIIYDDGSTDGTLDILEEYKNSKDNVQLIKKDHSYIDNLNESLLNCNTEYYCRIDGDDIYYPNRISTLVEYIDKHQDVSIACGNSDVFYEENNEKEVTNCIFDVHITLFDLIYMPNIIRNPITLFRIKDINDKNILYKNDTSYNEDLEFWLNCISKGLKIDFIHNVIGCMVFCPNSLSRNPKTHDIMMERRKYIKEEYSKFLKRR